MKKNNASEKGSPHPVRRSARISSATYKSSPPLLPESSTSTNRRWSKKIKPKSKPRIGNSGMRSNWTEAQRAHLFFHKLSQSLSRKTMNFNWGPLNDERTSILPSGDTFNWTDLSSGTTWIAVRGITAYVVVAMDPLENKSSLREYYHGMPPPPLFAVLSVLNQMGDPSSTFNKNVVHHAQGNPFAVVSAAPTTFEVLQERTQASSRAIDFLKAKLLDCSDLNSTKIVKLAVCALKLMFDPNFKSDQIVQAFYDRLGWSRGSNKLSTTNVDECLKELNVEATSNEAEKKCDKDRNKS